MGTGLTQCLGKALVTRFFRPQPEDMEITRPTVIDRPAEDWDGGFDALADCSRQRREGHLEEPVRKALKAQSVAELGSWADAEGLD